MLSAKALTRDKLEFFLLNQFFNNRYFKIFKKIQEDWQEAPHYYSSVTIPETEQ